VLYPETSAGAGHVFKAHIAVAGDRVWRRLPVGRPREADASVEMQIGLGLQTNHPSSSSRRVGAGRGAPAPSVVGRRTYPRSPKGFKDLIDESRPLCCDVFTGMSASLRLQPSEFIDSRNDAEAMMSTGRIL
jgi:hypothetical protein